MGRMSGGECGTGSGSGAATMEAGLKVNVTDVIPTYHLCYKMDY